MTGSTWPISSQYAERGVYTIYRFEAEELPDGRLIVGNYIAKGDDNFLDNMKEDDRYSGTEIRTIRYEDF